MVGICRGAQFLTVMNGGKLVQHVNNHAISGTHPCHIKMPSGPKAVKIETVEVTSTHHQMMYPWTMCFTDYHIIGYSRSLCTKYEGTPECESSERYLVNPHTVPIEPEVVWYPKSQCLCAQFHPEVMDENSGGFKIYQDLLGHFIFPE